MAISWREELAQSYAGPQKWGTGINRVHGNIDDGTGRVLAPGEAPYGLPANSPLLGSEYGYTTEDLAATGDMSFTVEHPGWGQSSGRGRSDLPPWGHRKGPPAGTGLRSLKRGMSEKETEAQVIPSETVSEGWTNKVNGAISDSVVSDPSQYERQTSMQQRDQTRVNSAATIRGTDVSREGIASRIVGMKVKNYSEGERLEDMMPWTQDLWHRVFRLRTAGTADPNLLQSNEMYVSDPMTRDIPPDVNQGVNETAGNYGYTDGDYYV